MMKQLVLAKLGFRPRLTPGQVLWPLAGIVVTSAAVGATFALLFAPKPGKELRHDIAEGASAGARRVGQATSRAREAVRSATDRVTHRSDHETIAPEVRIDVTESASTAV